MEEIKFTKVKDSKVAKEAFQHFFNKTKEYFMKRENTSQIKVSYLDICDYITGHLSNKGDIIDLDWYHNERDMGGFSEEIIKTVKTYCYHMVIAEGKRFILENEIDL